MPDSLDQRLDPLLITYALRLLRAGDSTHDLRCEEQLRAVVALLACAGGGRDA